MGKIKIEKKFFDLIKSGKKKYEFRKLEKGLTNGIYEVVSLDESVMYGHIELKVEKLNPKLYSHYSYNNSPNWDRHIFIMIDDKRYYVNVDEYNFIKENYIDKKIDFVAYAVKVVE